MVNVEFFQPGDAEYNPNDPMKPKTEEVLRDRLTPKSQENHPGRIRSYDGYMVDAVFLPDELSKGEMVNTFEIQDTNPLSESFAKNITSLAELLEKMRSSRRTALEHRIRDLREDLKTHEQELQWMCQKENE